jgi:prepilin-type N-terminal cleavage/methylation domain-containing protein
MRSAEMVPGVTFFSRLILMHHQPISRPRGFTLVEMITVMSIILVLAGIAFTSYGVVMKNIKTARTKAQLQALSMALDKYQREYGFYPLVDVDTANATYNPGQFTNANGQTLDGFPVRAAFFGDLVDRNGKRFEDFQGLGFAVDGTYGYVDPFGNPWHYDAISQVMNSTAFDLWSVGADGAHGRAGTLLSNARAASADDSDDVSNWKRSQ